MSKCVQLDLFDEYSRLEEIEGELERLEEGQGNLRRGLFRRHGELSRMYVELWGEVENLKLEIERLKEGTKVK